MDYVEAVGYLDSFINYEKIGYRQRRLFNLERMRCLSSVFTNPDKSFPSIHIAGTKGKGSIASFISNILRQAGFCVGLYTSPHITSLRERIKINNQMISRKSFSFHAGRIKEKLKAQSPEFCPTYFEIFTSLAFNYFKTKNIDYAVIEAGLGGRLDATNIIDSLISVITPVSYDHMHILGGTLKEIALEKSAIIKEDSVVVSAPQERDVFEIIDKRCKSLNVPMILVGKDVKFNHAHCDSEKEIFNMHGMLGNYEHCVTRLLGRHQIVNAACAVGVAEALIKKGVKISNENIKSGIKETQNPARCEVIAKKPYIILDGAQNAASASALKDTVKRNFNYKHLILVLGVSKGKDIKGICEELVSLADTIILTKAKMERAEEPRLIRQFIKKENLILTNSVREAVEKARALAGIEDMVVITGSFFVAGEAWKIQSSRYQPR